MGWVELHLGEKEPIVVKSTSTDSQGGICINVIINSDMKVPKPAPTHSTFLPSINKSRNHGSS